MKWPIPRGQSPANPVRCWTPLAPLLPLHPRISMPLLLVWSQAGLPRCQGQQRALWRSAQLLKFLTLIWWSLKPHALSLENISSV